jgi:hypothetical protein
VTWTIPPTADLRAFLADLEPVAAALLGVGVASVLMLLVGLILLVRGRRRRKAAARAARAAAAAAPRREPAIRRSTPSPLFAGRGDQADVLGSGLRGTTGALGVVRALEAADRAEPVEPDPPLPRWLDAGPEPVVVAESEPAVEPAPQVETVVESVVEAVPGPGPVAEPSAAPAAPASPAPPAPAFVRSVDTWAARQPRRERVRIEPWMVVAGAVLFLAGRRGRPRRPSE